MRHPASLVICLFICICLSMFGNVILRQQATTFFGKTNLANAPTAPFAGPVTVNGTDYATLKAAFDAINAGTHTGAITITIFGNTTETATASLNRSGSGSASYTSVAIQPSGSWVISGDLAGSPLIELNGADNVTINGLNTGGNSLTLSNTSISSTSQTATVKFINDATNNLITNCTILGSSTVTTATNGGTIFFSTATSGGTGNDNNTISNCNIGPSSAGLPIKAIYANGSTTSTTINNSNIAITGCNIYDYFNASSANRGILINDGNTDWTISNNKFYQTTPRTWTSGTTHYVISINNDQGNNFQITNNTIGFASSAGTGIYTINGSTNRFRAIDLTVGTATATNVQGNTIAGISHNTTTSGSAASTPCAMIVNNVNSGLVNIGNITGNTIGNLTGTGSITFSSSSSTTSDVYGVLNLGLSNTNISNNNIGAVSVTNSGTGGVVFMGIRAQTNVAVTETITNNIIGGTIVNSIHNTAPGSSSSIVGIQNDASGGSFSPIAAISGNVIRNFTHTASNASNSSNAAIIGIAQLASISSGHNITNNIIHSLSSTASGVSETGFVIGLFYSGTDSGANIVSHNFIHSLSRPASSNSGGLYGIRSSLGFTNFHNNLVRLGINATGSSITGGFDIEGIRNDNGANNFYFNSVYIGGSNVDGSANTYSFISFASGTARIFQNNIFANARSNGTGTGKHFAIRVAGSTPNPTGLTINYNVYSVSGLGGFLGSHENDNTPITSLSAWQTAVGQDANSFSGDPLFINPAGTADDLDLHVLSSSSPASNAGTTISGITTDYDGQTRNASTPDIGADEFTVCTSIVTNGNWSNPATWGCGGVPTATDTAVIANGHTVTADTNPTASSVVVQSGGTLTVSGTRTASSNLLVNGTLELNGDLNTSNYLVKMSSGAACGSGTGDVVGNVQRSTLTTGTAYCFGNFGNQINFSSATFNTPSLTVNLVKSAGSLGGTVTRLYTINPTNISSFSASVQLRYLDSELNGLTESGFKLWRYNGTAWVDMGGTHDTTNNFVSTSGVTAFSPWAIGPNAPTAVTMAGLSATTYDSGTLIEWQTGEEVSNLGFVVYREDKGQRVALTPSLVAGSALRAGVGTKLTAGLSYAWWEAGSGAGSYWVEDWEVDGSRTLHGPVSPRFVGGKAPAFSPAALLGQAQPVNGVTAPVEPKAAALTAQRATQLRSFAGQAAIKIGVQQSGWQRVTQAQLLAAGFTEKSDPRTLQLFVDGVEIPCLINGETDGRLDAEDTLEFYGLGVDTPATDTRVYWLVDLGNKTPRRLSQTPFVGGAATAANFPATVERSDHAIYFSGLLNGPAENFFGAVVAGTPVNQTLLSRAADRTASGNATLEIVLQGVTAGPHAVSLSLNGTPLGTMLYADRQHPAQSFSVPVWLLRDENTVTLQAAASGDVSLIEALRLTYPHSYQAEDELLRVPALPGQLVTVGGFTTRAVRVLDVTDEFNVVELAAQIAGTKTGYSAAVSVGGHGARQLLFVGEARTAIRTPVRVTANVPSHWRTPNQAADLVILTHASLRPAFETLASYRRAQGWHVAVVDVEDVYDELRQGQKDPAALTEFLSYAAANWTVKPRYVLLAGKATYDPRNYRGVGDFDLVPTQLVDTAQLETASDDALVDFNRDGLADLAVGRLPARTLAEAQRLVARIQAYEQTRGGREAILVADRNDGYNFEQASETLAGLLPTGTTIERLYRNQLGDATTRARLLDAFRRGPKLVNYAGHGSTGLWRGNLLTNADAAQLGESRLTFLLAMTCLNGYVLDPVNDALSEALLKAPAGGAIAVWASSTLTGAAGQAQINTQAYQHLFASGQRLGDATRLAKQATSDPDVRCSWLLLGDPLLQVR